eukprot:SAG25_NODE_5179_length_692_cov_1.129848_1_plen_47_part_01
MALRCCYASLRDDLYDTCAGATLSSADGATSKHGTQVECDRNTTHRS